MTEAEERDLWEMVCAAFDAKGTPEFDGRVRAIEDAWRDRYELWLIRNRDRTRRPPA